MGLIPGPMLKVHYWGEVGYNLSVQRQLEIVESVKSSSQDHLVFCTHPPIVTLGRSSKESDIIDWKGPVFQSRRGGKATYHGPSQIIVYPILDLHKKRLHLQAGDIHAYLRSLEQWLVTSLRTLSIQQATSKSMEMGKPSTPTETKGSSMTSTETKSSSVTGVWVGEKKIASIGIAVRSWITYHGIALNLRRDSQAFCGIHPCGFNSHVMTSMEDVLGKKLDRVQVTQVLKDQFEKTFHPL